jgi:RsiW-degrading membrane proteinase PrsW (M82 family)
LSGRIAVTTVTSSTAPRIAPALRRLYFVRFGFAIVWAVLLFATKSDLGPVSIPLLVLYPLFDAAAAVVDTRSSGTTGPARGLQVNIAISLLATIGVAVACASDVPAVLRVWGAWAIVSGLVQLVVGAARRTMGGQWPMILSGGISVLAGASFILSASGANPSLANIAGYAVLGGIFFLVSALRLGRAVKER